MAPFGLSEPPLCTYMLGKYLWVGIFQPNSGPSFPNSHWKISRALRHDHKNMKIPFLLVPEHSGKKNTSHVRHQHSNHCVNSARQCFGASGFLRMFGAHHRLAASNSSKSCEPVCCFNLSQVWREKIEKKWNHIPGCHLATTCSSSPQQAPA